MFEVWLRMLSWCMRFLVFFFWGAAPFMRIFIAIPRYNTEFIQPSVLDSTWKSLILTYSCKISFFPFFNAVKISDNLWLQVHVWHILLLLCFDHTEAHEQSWVWQVQHALYCQTEALSPCVKLKLTVVLTNRQLFTHKAIYVRHILPTHSLTLILHLEETAFKMLCKYSNTNGPRRFD